MVSRIALVQATQVVGGDEYFIFQVLRVIGVFLEESGNSSVGGLGGVPGEAGRKPTLGEKDVACALYFLEFLEEGGNVFLGIGTPPGVVEPSEGLLYPHLVDPVVLVEKGVEHAITSLHVRRKGRKNVEEFTNEVLVGHGTGNEILEIVMQGGIAQQDIQGKGDTVSVIQIDAEEEGVSLENAQQLLAHLGRSVEGNKGFEIEILVHRLRGIINHGPAKAFEVILEKLSTSLVEVSVIDNTQEV